ncbi:MAG: SUMF1/EgtB/PvdO family nonheme iron enzyme [Verrucomicrobia bacterium]|nr:SUMF1/EgtB/PvdO family nonheme iron enzyme [Verrucomicrobiota bacterium]
MNRLSLSAFAAILSLINSTTSIAATDDAFVKEVAALPAEQQVQRVTAELKRLNPNFDGKETHKIEGGAVTELAFSTTGVADISPVKSLKWLRKLTITPPIANQKGAVADLLPLRDLQLTWLWCHNNPISDLSPLRGMPLAVLSCGGTQVNDLSPLSGMKLTVLSVNDTVVNDLSPLQGMPLTVLWCNNTRVNDLGPLRAAPLQDLKCDFVASRDAPILRCIKTLARINDMPTQTFWVRAGSASASGATSGLPQSPATSPAQTTIGTAKPGQSLVISAGIELVYIPPGEYLRGSAADEKAWAVATGHLGQGYVNREGKQPLKTTISQCFWIGRTEVTFGQWKQFNSATSYVTEAEKVGKKKENWRYPRPGFLPKSNHPVTCVTWNDAMAFCDWLNGQESKAGRLPSGYAIRLPTEAEWEYACRAGTQTRFWWGDSVEDGRGRVNWAGKDDGSDFISPVDHYGARGRNKFGLADMLGNVWELCMDGFDGREPHERLWKGNDSTHVKRGGAFNRPPACGRCAYRSPEDSAAVNSVGFRICCGPSQ